MTSLPTRLSILSFTAMAMIPAAAMANAADEREYLPGNIVVTGQRQGYVEDDGSSGTKTPTPLIDVPQTIGVITRDQLEDQGVSQLADALAFVPGVSLESGEGNRDAVFIRGQESTADFYLDGLRDDAQYYRSLYNIERIEVLKGANALIFGRGGGGGVINRVSKTALLNGNSAGFDASVDSFGAFALAGDVTSRISDIAALRVNATYEEFGNQRDFYEGRFIGISPTLTVELGPETRLTAHYTYDDDRRLADRGIPALNNAPLAGYDKTLFGDPDFNTSHTRVHIARTRIEHEFSGDLSANASLQFADYDKLYANVVPGATDGTSVSLSGYENLTDRQNLIGQANLIWQVSTGRVKHTVLAGFEIGDQQTDDSRRIAQFEATGGPAASISVPLARKLAIPAISLAAPSRARDSQVTTLSAYVQDQIEIGEHLQLIAGLRWDSFDLDTRDQLSGATEGRKDEMVSPRFGLVAKPSETFSLYASYAQSFLPQSGDQFISLSSSTAALDPEKFENIELGAKWLIQPDLFLTAALFQLDRTNTTAPDPLIPGNIVLTGSTRTKGIELNLAGSITEYWQTNIGYTYLDGEIRNTTSAAPVGARLEQLPRHQLGIWNRFQLSKQFGLGLGAIYQDEQFASVSNTVKLPDYWRFDAAAYWDISERLSVQVNVENLFDETYYPSAHGNNNIQPATPFSARFGVRLKM
ncbi:MAG: TonB-dependent siderophore receptor [Alphaproteobacteria bacterium]|nr:MAG: TonB-dependent siderophore receptor [Alphaproteobacteria bacterium]